MRYNEIVPTFFLIIKVGARNASNTVFKFLLNGLMSWRLTCQLAPTPISSIIAPGRIYCFRSAPKSDTRRFSLLSISLVASGTSAEVRCLFILYTTFAPVSKRVLNIYKVERCNEAFNSGRPSPPQPSPARPSRVHCKPERVAVMHAQMNSRNVQHSDIHYKNAMRKRCDIYVTYPLDFHNPCDLRASFKQFLSTHGIVVPVSGVSRKSVRRGSRYAFCLLTGGM